jgi:hypothetical protein
MNNGLTGCDIAAIVVGVLVVLGIVLTLPDIAKYLKLKSM